LEVAKEEYLCTGKDQKVHELLANYFEGKWATTPIAYKDKNNIEKEALRYVAMQPYVSNSSIPSIDNWLVLSTESGEFKFDPFKLFEGGNVNYRKLIELPHHLIKTKNIDHLLKVICDFHFIQASIIGQKYFDLLSYYAQAIRT
jgi:hypothetical protein